jgi:hypothetical protein
MRRAIMLVAVGLCGSPLWAGSPDNPGAGGNFLKEEAQALKAEGQTVGGFLNETRDADPDFNLGQHIQDFGEQFLGSTPNPANDNGQGND